MGYGGAREERLIALRVAKELKTIILRVLYPSKHASTEPGSKAKYSVGTATAAF